jgi:high-affinity nickel-transport protein
VLNLVIGGAICASFVVFGALSVLLYKPWRRHVDLRRPAGPRENPEPTPLDEESGNTPGQDAPDSCYVAIPSTK